MFLLRTSNTCTFKKREVEDCDFGPNQNKNILRSVEIKIYIHFKLSRLACFYIFSNFQEIFVRHVEVKTKAEDFLSNPTSEGFVISSNSEKEI